MLCHADNVTSYSGSSHVGNEVKKSPSNGTPTALSCVIARVYPPTSLSPRSFFCPRPPYDGASMRFLRAHRDLLPAVGLTLTALVIGVLLFGRFLFPYAQPLGFDEGYMVSFAERVIDGRWLPYVDGVSHRGPALYWFLALAQLLTGRYEWIGIRVVGLLGCLVTVSATFLAGAAARWALAGAIGGAAYVFLIAAEDMPKDGIAVFGEQVATPCLAVSFCLLAIALCRTPPGRRRAVLLVLAGVCSALSAMTKQTTGTALVPFLLWVLVHAWSEADSSENKTSRKRFAWCLPALGFLAGWGGMFLLLILWYVAHGAFGELVYWSLTYNTAVYMQPYRGGVWREVMAWLHGQHDALIGIALAATVAVVRPVVLATSFSRRGLMQAYARAGFEVTAALSAILLLAGAAAPARFWSNYFVPTYPWFGLVAGVLVELLARGDGQGHGKGLTRLRQTAPAVVIAVVLAFAGGLRLHNLNQQFAAGAWENPRPDPICAHIDKYARPEDSIFVWGFDGDLYITCRRRPAARYTYLTMVAGIVPPFWGESRPERVAPGTRKTLRADLEQNRPAVILDVPIGDTFSMDGIPELAAFLSRDYCPLPQVTGKRNRTPKFYGRRDSGVCGSP